MVLMHHRSEDDEQEAICLATCHVCWCQCHPLLFIFQMGECSGSTLAVHAHVHFKLCQMCRERKPWRISVLFFSPFLLHTPDSCTMSQSHFNQRLQRMRVLLRFFVIDSRGDTLFIQISAWISLKSLSDQLLIYCKDQWCFRVMQFLAKKKRTSSNTTSISNDPSVYMLFCLQHPTNPT